MIMPKILRLNAFILLYFTSDEWGGCRCCVCGPLYSNEIPVTTELMWKGMEIKSGIYSWNMERYRNIFTWNVSIFKIFPVPFCIQSAFATKFRYGYHTCTHILCKKYYVSNTSFIHNRKYSSASKGLRSEVNILFDDENETSFQEFSKYLDQPLTLYRPDFSEPGTARRWPNHPSI